MTPAEPVTAPKALTARRSLTLAALLAAATPALAQMPGGMGMGGRPGERPRPQPRTAGPGESVPPPDLVSTFERRLLPLRLELDLSPQQQARFDRFLVALQELAQHNQRRLQRVFGLQLRSVSVAAPVQALLDGELRDAEDRLQAVTDLLAAWNDLDATLLPPQREQVHAAFNAARSELRSQSLPL